MPFTSGAVLYASDFEWQSYTPTITGITIGNGTVVGRYYRQRDTVLMEVLVTLGSTSAVTGAVTVSFPVTAARSKHVGSAVAAPAGAANYTLTPMAASSSTAVSVLVQGTGGLLSSISSTSPATWATDGWLLVRVNYEAA